MCKCFHPEGVARAPSLVTLNAPLSADFSGTITSFIPYFIIKEYNTNMFILLVMVSDGSVSRAFQYDLTQSESSISPNLFSNFWII